MADLQLPPELADTNTLVSLASFQVSNDTTAEQAAIHIKEIEGRMKAIKAKQNELFGPLKSAIRDFEARVKDITTPLKIASDTLRARIARFWDKRQEGLDKQAKVDQEIALREAERQRDAAIDLAMESGSPEAIKNAHNRNTALERLQQSAPKVSQTIRSTGVTLSQTKTWKWRVVDPCMVPDEYWVLDEKKLNGIAKKYSKEGHDIPGIEFYQESRATLSR